MKKILLLLAIVIAGFKSAPLLASGTPLAKGEMVTKEIAYQNGTLEIQVKVKTTSDVFFASEPTFTLPKGWAVNHINKLKKTKCKKDGPIIFTLIVSYPKTNLPFFPKEISCAIKVESVSDSAVAQTIFVEGRIYFTPYKTVEIWSAADFHNSKRVWLTENSAINKTRIYIPKNSIPKTNIPKNYSMQALWEDDYTLKRVEGLAYSIPMLAIHPDSIAKYNNDDLPIGVEPDSLFETTVPALSPQLKVNSTAKIRLKRRFTGTISGRLVTHIINDLGQYKTIPLVGVNILLKEYDWYANETFAEVHTGSDGYFSFTYNEDQSFAEGKTITLFLKYKSRNTTYDIKVKEHSVFGGSYEETTWLSDQGQNVSLNLGEVYLDNDAYKPLHYAVRAWQFSNNNGIYLRPDLTILAYQAESYFLPDGAGGISSPITRPTIRLGDGDENDENTIYHEFGHFFQWNVQDKNYATPIFKDKSGDHVWYETNTSRAAWTEGWADAFQMILDAAYWYEDMEYGYDNDDVRPTYEVRDIWNFSNGMESEYYIACAIYDLWDGKNKGLPNRMPRRPGTPNIHGYNDEENGTWETTDNVQLSFNQIVRPMRINSSSSSVIGNIYTYYSLLVNNVLKDECNLVSDVARCFNENRVVKMSFM